jgi:hypothetical protein
LEYDDFPLIYSNLSVTPLIKYPSSLFLFMICKSAVGLFCG